jgi:hypothetical protein
MGMPKGKGQGAKGKGKLPACPLLKSLDFAPFPFSLPEGFCPMPNPQSPTASPHSLITANNEE